MNFPITGQTFPIHINIKAVANHIEEKKWKNRNDSENITGERGQDF